MAEHRPTIKASGDEGVSVMLTEDNYPRCLRERGAGFALDSCGDIALFLREAVMSMFTVSKERDLPSGDEMDRVVLGFEKCCDLLLDHLDLAAGTSPLPMLKDLEAHHG